MAIILQDNFDSYADGDLNAQGGWSGNAGFDVQGTTVQSGAKAIKFTVSGITNVDITNTGTSISDGSISCYLRKSSVSDADDSSQFNLLTVTQANAILLRFFGNRIDVFDQGIADWFTVKSNLLADVWYLIEIEWHSSPSYQMRMRLDGDSWTAWKTPQADGPYNTVQLEVSADTAADYFWDTVVNSLNQRESITLATESTSFLFKRFQLNIQDTVALASESISIIRRSLEIVVSDAINLVTGIVNLDLRENARILWTFLSKNVTSWTHQSKSASPSWTWEDKHEITG